MKQVAIEELRQNLSAHLRCIQRGESLEVTEQGRAVAVLSPIHECDGGLAALHSSGKLTPARARIGELGPPEPAPTAAPAAASEALVAERADRL